MAQTPSSDAERRRLRRHRGEAAIPQAQHDGIEHLVARASSTRVQSSTLRPAIFAGPRQQAPAGRHAEQIDQHEVAIGVADQRIEGADAAKDQGDGDETDGEHPGKGMQGSAGREARGETGSLPSRAMLR